MIIDSHVHICNLNQSNRMLRWLYQRRLGPLSKEQNLITHLNSSQIDKAIFLAIDQCYDFQGEPCPDRTSLYVSNHYIESLLENSPKILYGASVHPYRKDVLDELQRVSNKGAALIKIIPSAQNIDLTADRARPFLEFLAIHKIPLLCHTGNEHALSVINNDLNHPRQLIPALKMGVIVIAAHLGERAFIYEKSFFNEWQNLALEYPNLYGDISAFIMPLRIKALRRVLENEELSRKIFYGSDFPMLALPSSLIPQIGVKEYLRLRDIDNHFDFGVKALLKFGVPLQIFGQIENILPKSAANLYK